MNRLSYLVGIALLLAAGAVHAENQPSHQGATTKKADGESISRATESSVRGVKEHRKDRTPDITREERKAYAKVKFYKEVQKCWVEQEVVNKIIGLTKMELLAASAAEQAVANKKIDSLKNSLNG